jgi:aspartyl-tRNA(Asn)/glutamyl-tRNA(Gln) amidotransferase subunit A
MIDIKNLTIIDARAKLMKGEFKASELLEAVLANIAEKNGEVNAYLEVFEDARTQAKAADVLIESGATAPLLGIPVAIKDNMLYEGHLATAGSKILEGYKSTMTAHAVQALVNAGAIIVGRANMDEFAMGSTGENSAYGATKNPLDLNRVAGGSSSGSAAVVAMGGALGSLGTDTGGSVRTPASHTGLVGLKPTYGAVSRSGIMAMASSFDQVGPFTKTVTDAELLYSVIDKQDPEDMTSVPNDARPTAWAKSHFKIGVPEDFVNNEGIDADVRAKFKEMLAKMEAKGHKIIPVSLPTLPAALAVYYVLVPAEVSSNLARYDGVRYGVRVPGETLLDTYKNTRAEGFGEEVRRRVLLGTYVLSAGYYDAYYNKAALVRRKLTDEVAEAFKGVDVIAMPSAVSPAPKIGELSEDPTGMKMYLADILTVTANTVGVPAISVPMGTLDREGKDLPIGMQFMAPHFHEQYLFGIGREVEALR